MTSVDFPLNSMRGKIFDIIQKNIETTRVRSRKKTKYTAFRAVTLHDLKLDCFPSNCIKSSVISRQLLRSPVMSIETPKLDILVSGSGIAGPVFAFWLHKLLPNAIITILERAPKPRLGGQAVDLRSASVPIVEKMGLLQVVKEHTTTEVGIDFIYADGKTKATFPASGDANRQSGRIRSLV